MKLPFVSREIYERAVEQIDIEREVSTVLRRDLLATIEKADARYNDLLARYHMLRVQGHVPMAPLSLDPPRSVDPVSAAISKAAGGDPELRAMMEAQATVDRASGKSDGDIVAAIYLGQAATDGTFI